MSIIKNTEELNNLLDAVQKLPVKKDEQEKIIGITESGTTEVTPDEGKTLSKVTVNVEVESNEEFTGFKLSGFSGGYSLPTVVDARDIPLPSLTQLGYNGNFTSSWFANPTANGNGGYWVLLKEVYLPDGLLTFSTSMFSNCSNLENLYGDFTNVKSISLGAFNYCKSLTNFPYMPNLRRIDTNAFQNCTGLTKFKFYVKPDVENDVTVTLANTAFNGCTNITDIYCPWAEGEVDNAPWGATNATIHYNTTYDKNHNPIVSEV